MALNFTKDTISEYDMILSISQEAINTQLKTLWERELDETDDDGRTLYAINHDWTVQVETYRDENGNDVLDRDVGLFAHIKPPRIEFSGEQNGVAIAKMIIQFTNDATVVEDKENHKSPDSLFYKYTGPPKKPVLSTFNLTGWSVSWKVELGRKEIPDVMNDLIRRHETPDDPTYLPPGAVETLSNIRPELYTVSSIFCLFQNALFVNTFELIDDSGVVITKDTPSKDNDGKPFRQSDAVTMMDHISAYFTDIQKVERNNGIPNPNNFVLGYGLMQKVQDLRNINPEASWKNTPAYFLPAEYALTSTTKKVSESKTVVKPPAKPPIQTPQSPKEPELNTLNFCIMTHRSKDPKTDQIRKVAPNDQNAGKLVDNFYDVTMTKQGDGIMAWSTDLFWNKWVLGELMSTLWLDPSPILRSIDSELAVAKGSTMRQWDMTDSDKPGNFRRDLTFRSYRNVFDLAGGIGSINYWIDGYSNFNIQAYSDLQMNKNNLPNDYRRRAYITAYVDYKLTVHYESGVISTPTPAFDSVVTVRHKICIALEPGSGGVWNATCDASQTLPSTIAGALNNPGPDAPIYITFVDLGEGGSAPGGTERGAWVETHQYDSGWLIKAKSKQAVAKGAMEKTAASVQGLMQRLAAALGGMGSCIMMPGGEVMTFNGLTTDTEGRLYAHVVYALGADGITPVGENKS